MFKATSSRLKYTNRSYRNTKKICSIFIIFLLVFNIFSITALSFETDSSPSESEKEKLTSIQQRIERLREMIKNLIDKIKERKNQRFNTLTEGVKTSDTNLVTKNPIISYCRTYLGLKSSSSSLFLYTNYGGIEKETEISMFQTLRVDVNNDGVNDISAQLVLYPSIDISNGFSINFRLKINILKLPNSFPDKKAFFESYIEMEFPGYLNAEWKEDRVRFGYKSEDSQIVPDSCIVTYKFAPSLFDSSKKPRHKVELSTGGITGINSLSMIFRYAQIDDGVVDEYNLWEIKNTPAVKKTEICVHRSDEHVGINLDVDLFGDQALTDIYYIKEKMGESSEIGLIIEKMSSFTFALELTPLSNGGGK